MFVEQQLFNLHIPFKNVELGYIELAGHVPETQIAALNTALKKAGLEVLNSKRNIVIEKTTQAIDEILNNDSKSHDINYSVYISKQVGTDYATIAKLFSEVKGITLQQFIIIRKIEKIKEYLLYYDLPLAEIAYRLQYSSVPHLSNQFKKITGLSPSFFKSIQKAKPSC